MRKNLKVRPAFKTFTGDISKSRDFEATPLLQESVRLLLETWNTLNVYCQVYTLDSFTFDDFVEAMQLGYETIESELFVEIHCAVLKLLEPNFVLLHDLIFVDVIFQLFRG